MATDPEFKLIVQVLVDTLCRIVKAVFEGSPTLSMSGTIEVGQLIGGMIIQPDMVRSSVDSDLQTQMIGSRIVQLPIMSSKPAPTPRMSKVWDGSN